MTRFTRRSVIAGGASALLAATALPAWAARGVIAGERRTCIDTHHRMAGELSRRIAGGEAVGPLLKTAHCPHCATRIGTDFRASGMAA